MLYHKWLDIVPCATQWSLIIYPPHMQEFASTNPTLPVHPPPSPSASPRLRQTSLILHFKYQQIFLAKMDCRQQIRNMYLCVIRSCKTTVAFLLAVMEISGKSFLMAEGWLSKWGFPSLAILKCTLFQIHETASGRLCLPPASAWQSPRRVLTSLTYSKVQGDTCQLSSARETVGREERAKSINPISCSCLFFFLFSFFRLRLSSHGFFRLCVSVWVKGKESFGASWRFSLLITLQVKPPAVLPIINSQSAHKLPTTSLLGNFLSHKSSNLPYG